ncbi:helix-turn-helix domain-containing protein [Jiulongibacter sp. NS-SX5]|uniref:helix-turn-helix domain-containing protein n=1 Tax=Jiulongibacter sp. NS-SX5 TaxID=3463854 RepID=UPI0040580870
MSDFNRNIGQRLYQYRTAAGFSQEDFAAALNVNISTYKNYESHKVRLPLETAAAAAEILGVSIDKIVKGDMKIETQIKDLKESVSEEIKRVENEKKPKNMVFDRVQLERVRSACDTLERCLDRKNK